MVKNEKEMAINFYSKMTTVEDKMADPFFSKQEDEKNGINVVQRLQRNATWTTWRKEQTKRADERLV